MCHLVTLSHSGTGSRPLLAQTASLGVSGWRRVERHLTQKFGHAENKRVKPIGRGPHKAVVFHGVSRANGPKRHTWPFLPCMRSRRPIHRPHRTVFQVVEPPTRSRGAGPVSRPLQQPPLHRIVMHVVELLRHFPVAPDVHLIKSSLAHPMVSVVMHRGRGRERPQHCLAPRRLRLFAEAFQNELCRALFELLRDL